MNLLDIVILSLLVTNLNREHGDRVFYWSVVFLLLRISTVSAGEIAP